MLTFSFTLHVYMYINLSYKNQFLSTDISTLKNNNFIDFSGPLSSANSVTKISLNHICQKEKNLCIVNVQCLIRKSNIYKEMSRQYSIYIEKEKHWVLLYFTFFITKTAIISKRKTTYYDSVCYWGAFTMHNTLSIQ